MKKQLLLSLAITTSLFVITPSLIGYGKSSEQSEECSKHKKGKPEQKKEKPVERKESSHKKEVVSEKSDNAKYDSGKAKMSKIERELAHVEKQYNKNHDKEAANAKIEEIQARVTSAVTLMRSSKEHSALTKRHEHRLHNEIARVKRVVNR